MEYLNILINNIVSGNVDGIYEKNNDIYGTHINNDSTKPNIIHIMFGGTDDENFSSIYDALLIKSLDGEYMYIDKLGIKPVNNINLLHIRKGINWDELIDFDKLNLNTEFTFTIVDIICGTKSQEFEFDKWDTKNMAWLIYHDELETIDLNLVWDIINKIEF